MTRRSMGGIWVLALVAVPSVWTLLAGCDDSTPAETPPQLVPPIGPAGDGGAGSGDGSAEACKPGLPGTGLTTLSSGAQSGFHAALVLDDKGAPIVAHARVVSATSTVIEAFRWDATCGTWGSALTVDTVGAQASTGRQIAIAFDASTGALGVAYQALSAPGGTAEIRYAELKKGAAAFASPVRVDDPAKPAGGTHAVDTPGLAMGAGSVYLAYREANRVCNAVDCDGTVFRTRDAAGALGTEIDLSDASGAGASVFGSARASSIRVALDSDGNPGVAWQAYLSVGGVKGTVLFMHPGDAAPTMVLAGNTGASTDAPDLALAFDGKKPRVAAVFNVDPGGGASGQTEWFIPSDDGFNWGTPVPLPHDQGSSLDGYVSVTVGAASKVAVLSSSATNDGSATFGQPKILTSTDATNFTVGGVPKATFDRPAGWVNGAYGPDGKLSIALKAPAATGQTNVGLVYFHE